MKICVIIPVFNTKPAALMEAVECILNQDCGISAIEKIILVDDGSTNIHTLSTIGLLRETYSIIDVITKPNGGTSSAFNEGHKHVTTEYVAVMGSDDICDRSRFRLQMDYIKAHPETDVIGTNLFSFYDDDIRRKPVFTSTHREKPVGLANDPRWLVNHGTVIYRQSAVMEIGGYDENFPRGQDVQLWGRMSEKGYVFRNIETVLYCWRRYR